MAVVAIPVVLVFVMLLPIFVSSRTRSTSEEMQELLEEQEEEV